jgi:hypothetical protein
MLSVEQLRQVSFGKFKQDMNYTLRPGCWSIVQVSSPTLERGGVTWETGVVLEYVPYGGGTVETFYWHFQWRLERGQLVISGIGPRRAPSCKEVDVVSLL